MRNCLLMTILLAACVETVMAADADVITVGSKSFTENFILGEIIARIAEEAGEAPVERKLGLGSAAIAHAALLADEIRVDDRFYRRGHLCRCRGLTPTRPVHSNDR